MNSKLSLSNLLLRDDEKFWSQVKDEHKHAEYKSQLYRMRVFSLLVILVFIILTFVALIKAPNVAALGLLVMIPQLLNYLDTNSKLRTIKLYELFSEADKNS